MYWPATLVAPRVVQGYFSPTPLNVLLCERFSECPAKSSLHLDNFTDAHLCFIEQRTPRLLTERDVTSNELVAIVRLRAVRARGRTRAS